MTTRDFFIASIGFAIGPQQRGGGKNQKAEREETKKGIFHRGIGMRSYRPAQPSQPQRAIADTFYGGLTDAEADENQLVIYPQ